MVSPSIEAFSFGCDLSASAVAKKKNGKKFNFTPVAAKNAGWIAFRSSAILETSTSTTVVSWAEEFIEATARSARTFLSLDIGSDVPR
jgi:hypothetical protein